MITTAKWFVADLPDRLIKIRVGTRMVPPRWLIHYQVSEAAFNRRKWDQE